MFHAKTLTLRVNTVDLVIFVCLNICEFLILICDFLFFFSSAIIIIIFARFLNSRICPREILRKLKPREYYQIYSNEYEIGD